MKNELTQKIALLDMAIVTALLSAGEGDAFALYSFYCAASSKQSTDSVKATEEYCKRGLNWGTARYRKAKKVLADRGIIRQIIRKDEAGKVRGYYIKICSYLASQSSDFPLVDKTTPNALDINNINAYTAPDKKLSGPMRKKGKTIHTSLSYLTSLPLKDIDDFNQRFGFSPEKIKLEAEKASNWVSARGKRYKNYKRFFTNWLISTHERQNTDKVVGFGSGWKRY
jgi:hypothetical protein